MGFWAGLGATITGMAIGLLDLIYPLKTSGFGGRYSAGSVSDYPPGSEPKHFIEGRFWIVRITPNDGGGDGLLALWHKCPHLGCKVPWRGDFVFQGTKGWFLCPCHGSTYTKAGVRVFGPAPRSMDTMALDIDSSGGISVNASKIEQGGTDNPERAAKA